MIRTFLIRGASMEPSIRDFDLVVTTPLKGTPVVGDILVYREGSQGFLVAHRVILVNSWGIIMGGDANQCMDPLLVQRDQILGKVWLIIPRVGRLLALFRRELRENVS